MKNSKLLLPLLSALSLGFAPSRYAHAEDSAAEPIQVTQVKSAPGEVITLVGGDFKPIQLQGGYGAYVSDWKLEATIAVRETSGQQIFRIRDLTLVSGPSTSSLKVVYLNSNYNSVQRVGTDDQGRSLVEVEVSEPYFVIPGHTYSLEVIQPAFYVSIPDMNNPSPGWNGPTHGIVIK